MTQCLSKETKENKFTGEKYTINTQDVDGVRLIQVHYIPQGMQIIAHGFGNYKELQFICKGSFQLINNTLYMEDVIEIEEDDDLL